MRVALLSAEISPFVGGGIAPMVRATSQILAGAGHHVDIFTRAANRDRAGGFEPEAHTLFRHPRIQWHWVPEPANDAEHWHRAMAEQFNDALAAAYAHGAPDLVEIQDFQGLGAVVAADRAGGRLGNAFVALRLNTSAEQIADLDAVPMDPELANLERVSLLSSDLLLAPSEAVFDYYRDFYPGLALPPGVVLWPGFLRDDAPTPKPVRARRNDTLELLAIGRLQRCKGTATLARAVVEQPDLPIHLTFVGTDTPTGPSGSMRAYVEHLAESDARISLVGPVPRAQIDRFLADADAVVVASAWEAWCNVALESLAAARPLIVTPRASLPAMAGDGRFGLVANGIGIADMAQALRDAVEQQDRLRALAGDPALPAYLDELTDETAVVRGYESLAGRAERTPRKAFAVWADEASPAPVTADAEITHHPVSPATQATFAQIYDTERWTDRLPAMPRSGRGSLPEFSQSVIDHLEDGIASGAITSIADLGCGDLTFLKEIPAIRRGEVRYLGFDIVPSLIEAHSQLGWGEFAVADICEPGFRVEADVILVKDVLFHLENAQVLQALDNLRACRFDELLITSIDTASNDEREFDHWHYAPLNLELPPFSLRPGRRLPRDLGSVHVYGPGDLDR